jgi:OOP family OmpA-OmpF porin
MARKYFKLFFVLMIGALLASCATPQPLKPFTAFDVNPKVRSGDYVQKVDSFLTILDSSGSMAEGYKGDTKFNIAKNFVHRMNQTIPDIPLTGGLRKFGGTVSPFTKQTQLVYGMTSYSKDGFDEGLKTFTAPIGETPMASSIRAGAGDLKSASGRLAVIIVGDGRATDMKSTRAAEDMKSQYGDRLCIYTVAVGNDPGGIARMKRIARASGCGFSVNAESIGSASDMADFVERVFLAKAEKAAAPPPAPAPPGVLDSDRDGVPDDRDRCPGTPLGARVDRYGCWDIGNVLFGFDKSNVRSEYHAMLDEVVSVMNRNPGLKIALQGNTDSIGSAKYNRGLSMRRAKAVMEYLEKKGISRDRLSVIGYGLTRPVATNKTREGRKMNRRVELHPVL